MGFAKSIGSIIVHSVAGGSKLLTRTWWAIRKGRNQVKKSAREFYKILREIGIPEEDSKEITVAYAKPAWEILSITKLIKLAMEMGEHN